MTTQSTINRKQKQYIFELADEETSRSRRAYRVRFRPLDKGNLTWEGEALIDAAEAEPLRVFTHPSRRIPSIIRAQLGTDLPGFGYDMQYRRFDAGPLVSGQLRRRVSLVRSLLDQP